MLKLDVARLKRAPGDSARFELLAESLPPLELQGELLEFSGPVKAVLNVANTGSALTVEGEASGRIKLNCSRCLDPFDYPFTVSVQETYTPVPDGGEETVPFSGDVLDITPEVLKSIILSLPMKAVCRMDCLGLCPGCGHNLNEGRCRCEGEDVDPRLSVLKNLIKGREQPE
ncbi:MAG: DUF177 domain-containing protein [Pelotomaculum sp.]|nr:DUF177 domain-containing protein [Pelotomaculum sp.]